MQFGKGRAACLAGLPVPAAFWEKSLVGMLGEAEAAFLLGLYGMELMDVDPHRKMDTYARPVETYMLRSAKAGHPSGMYGAYLTGENRPGRLFPASLPKVPVLPEKFHPGMTAEGRYWLSQAAHAGHLFAMLALAVEYKGIATVNYRKDVPPKVAPDAEKMEEYYTMAVTTARMKRWPISLYSTPAGVFCLRTVKNPSIIPQSGCGWKRGIDHLG